MTIMVKCHGLISLALQKETRLIATERHLPYGITVLPAWGHEIRNLAIQRLNHLASGVLLKGVKVKLSP